MANTSSPSYKGWLFPRYSTEMPGLLFLFMNFSLLFALSFSSSSSDKIHTNLELLNLEGSNLTTHDVLIENCDISSGSWVHDSSYPLYNWKSCPYLDGEINCQKNGRPDSDYQKWRWKPLGCELPRFNALNLLQSMKGKTIMFVGDSLNRGQWESMMCLLHSALPQSRISFVSGDPISTFKALDYEVTMTFYRAPYLVDLVNIEVGGQKKVALQLDSIDINGEGWKAADILIFNSGHWWTHKGNLQGWDYMLEGNHLYPDMDRTVAYQKGMTTWANWIDSNIDTRRTRVFFQSYSPSHVSPKEWNNFKDANCFSEREPILGDSYPGPYPLLYKIPEAVIAGMRSKVYLMDITKMSLLRKDGHPSIYSTDFSLGQRKNPARYSDCSHWCLPGVPDTWNQLLYSALLFNL